MRQKKVVVWYVILSIAAAGMVLIISSISSADQGQPSDSDKAIVSSVFVAGCVFGVMQSAKLHRKKGNWQQSQAPTAIVSDVRSAERVGHHPRCGRFDDHVTDIGGKRYCSGCLGLAIGSIVALFLTLLYLAAKTPSTPFHVVLLYGGLALVALDLVETTIHPRANAVHVLANALLVIGFFLVAVGALGLTGSSMFGLLAILTSFLWLDTRIQLSKWKHAKVCQSCGKDCKSY